ncbi:MAG: exopolysaccharide biosynthesis polyprenyl glycosylphosphotransferase [Gemmatimonadaceae bacterium]
MTRSRTQRISSDATTRRRRATIENVVPATEPAPFPIVLQRRARLAVRRHLLRGATRTGILLLVDALTLLAARASLHAIRDIAALGSRAAEAAGALVPRGTFPPLQFLAAIVLGLVVRGAYGAGDRRRDSGRVIAGTALGLGLIFWSRVWNDGIDGFTLLGFAMAAISIGGALVIERLIIDRVVMRFRPASVDAPRTLLVGTPSDTGAARAHPALSDRRDFHLVAQLDATAVGFGETVDVTERLVTVIAREAIDTVVLCGYFETSPLRELIDVSDAAGCHLFSLPRSTEFSGLVPQMIWRRGAPLVQLTYPGTRGQHLLGKRALDIVGALAGMIVLAPLFILIAGAIKATSRGPVLFRQRRVGRGGRCFSILKFRSMVADAETRREQVGDRSIYADQRLFKIVSDPRVTRLGALLRRTSLDELPQLWNVLRGDMSLVGPRPPLPSEVKFYAAHHYGRFHMKPGITGPWQVGGRNRITDFEAVIRIEAAYMWQWSLWKDVVILLRTVPAVLRMNGAH